MNTNNLLVAYKNCLITDDYYRQLRLEYDETFILVVKLTLFYILLRLASSKSWPIHNLDVKSIFLYIIYMQ